MRAHAELIIFLGPSLSRREAERELRSVPGAGRAISFSIEPPAKQGDVWRALARRPRVLALIDGVFESSPSVWHHELLDAIDGGVLVFGAASMGALRASELAGRGVIGVGKIFARYRDGFDDDAAVALLHADAEHDFTPLTIPSVNAEHAIDEARRGRALTKAESLRMKAASENLHYQERRWPQILEGAKLSAPARARWDAFAAAGLPDRKADDARLCLKEAAKAAFAQRSSGSRPTARPRSPPPSARVRAVRAAQQLRDAGSDANDRDARNVEALRTLFIAAVARAAGISPDPPDLAAAEERLISTRDEGARESLLHRAGVAEDELRRAIETLALEEVALRQIDRFLADGPSPIEAKRLAALLRVLST